MRPLSATVRTALIFYGIFALFLLAAEHWAPSAAVPASATETREFSFERPGVIDLVFLQDSLDESWNQWLSDKGWRPNDLVRRVESQLLVKNVAQNQLRWVRNRTRLELPVDAGREALVEVGREWRNLVTSQGLTIRKINWGLGRRTVWVKLESEARVRMAGRALTLPMADILISQPRTGAEKHGWNWRGLVPEPVPKLKPGGAPPSRPAPTPAPTRPPVLVPPSPRPTAPAVQTRIPPVQRRARVALIIDDVGFVRGPADAMLKVPARLTWSVLPFTPYAAEYIAAARRRGFQIMLHLPLEPLDLKDNNPGPGLIKAEWPEDRIVAQLDADLAQVPGAVGLNNHMGSAGTHSDHLMDILMKALKARNLFFIDSNTADSAHPSVAGKYAQVYGVPFAKRRIFIDNSSDPESMKTELRELIKLALADGEAIGIGHVRNGTAEAITAMLPEFVKAGIEIVPASELVK